MFRIAIFYWWNIGLVRVISIPDRYILYQGLEMSGEDVRSPTKVIVQKLTATLNEPMNIGCFKKKKIFQGLEMSGEDSRSPTKVIVQKLTSTLNEPMNIGCLK